MFEIRENKLVFLGIELEINMPYEDMNRRLESYIYVKSDINENGLGHIVIKNTEFYGLKGKCSIHFREGLLKEVVFTPEWNRYNLNDENGQRLHIDQAIQRISSECINTLKSNFGEPVEISKYGQNVFEAGNYLLVITSVSRDCDNFSVIVGRNHEK